MAKKYEVGCQHDNCDTCPYPDCRATAHQANTGKCGSKSIPSSTDIRLPKEYKPQTDPPKPKAVIKGTLTGFTAYGGKVMDDEEKKRKKHEYYLRSKEKKMAEKEKAALEEANKGLSVKPADVKCERCLYSKICKYRDEIDNYVAQLPEILRLECIFFKDLDS